MSIQARIREGRVKDKTCDEAVPTARTVTADLPPQANPFPERRCGRQGSYR